MSQTKNRKATSTQSRTVRPSSHRKISGNAHGTTASSNKTLPGPSKRLSLVTSAQQESNHESDMPGLPEFCATCEKQIMTPPGTSILYCSEAYGLAQPRNTFADANLSQLPERRHFVSPIVNTHINFILDLRFLNFIVL